MENTMIKLLGCSKRNRPEIRPRTRRNEKKNLKTPFCSLAVFQQWLFVLAFFFFQIIVIYGLQQGYLVKNTALYSVYPTSSRAISTKFLPGIVDKCENMG